MSTAIRIPLSGFAKRLLPAFLSSDTSVSKLSSSDKLIKNYSSHSRQFSQMNPKLYGVSHSNMQQSHNVVNRFKNVKLPYLQVYPIRTMSFSVATALGSINSTTLDKRDSPSKMYFMTIDKIQNKSMKFENCRSFSSSEKPTSTQSSSLADEIMKSKMKETSQEKTANAEETNENSDKGRQPMSKWQKRGYVAFVIFLSGALVVNAVLFCK